MGKVSSVNGILDCLGYIGAAVSNMIFASMADNMEWNAVVILWSVIIMVGFVLGAFEQIKIIAKYKLRFKNGKFVKNSTRSFCGK